MDFYNLSQFYLYLYIILMSVKNKKNKKGSRKLC